MKIYNKAGKVLIEVPGNDLRNADLSYANLSDANLYNADLRNVDLSGADLSNANLRFANLRYANLRKANLHDANLYYADLSNANLRYANLSNAYLCNADLRDADLRYANLSDANLRKAILSNANLTGTCLDAKNSIPEIETSEILNAGLQIDGEYVIGFRTTKSQHCGDTVYESGKTYTAPWFSTDITKCHPGLYLASESWLKENYPNAETIRVRCLRSDLHKAGAKWRCRKLETLS